MASIRAVAVLVLVSAALADIMDRETYDDTPGDMELMYPEQNYVDMMPDPNPDTKTGATSQPMKNYDDNSNARRMLLYKMLIALRNHDSSPSYLSLPKWIPTGTVLVPPDTFNISPLKGSLGNMFKRSSDNNNIQGIKPRPLPRWNIKKGKAGPQMICYFKLCSFRTF